MVPIVLRKADYVDIAPPGSYIAADQFRSPKDLADYLHFLAKNPEEYLRYFDYTKTNKVVWNLNQMVEEGICRLCRMLQENRTTTIGTDMRAKWVEDKVDCVVDFAKTLL
jgi:alpha-1,3-fucosyltransferase